jgi:hypothetical protein
MLAETRFIDLDQAHLAGCGCGLQLMHRARPLLPAQALHALGDRAARYEHHFAPEPPQLGDLPRPARERLVVETPAAVGDEPAADLDDQAFGFG